MEKIKEDKLDNKIIIESQSSTSSNNSLTCNSSLKSLSTKLSESNSLNNPETNINVKIILKSIQNTITEVFVSMNIPIKEEIPKILERLNVSILTHDIKLIFAGKILATDNSFESYGNQLYSNIFILFLLL